ncbi:MAG: potassium channel family protein [Gaiellaceae bacterium]
MDGGLSMRRFALALAALFGVIGLGSVGFHLITHEGWLSAVYRALVTISLTGLDTEPPGSGAKLFTIVLLFAGVAIFLYVAGTIVELIARGVLSGAWLERRKRMAIGNMQDHFIICGYGRVGRRVGKEFREAGVPYVVLDYSDVALTSARERGDLIHVGSGTHDEDLHAVGLDRARGLVASADSDVDNLYIVLSARAKRPDLLIVARASDDDAATKLRLAGADRIVQPYSTAGREMAKLVLKPQVAAFLDVASATGGGDMQFEEIIVSEACVQNGKSLAELRARERTGAMIVALRKRDGSFDTTPAPEAVLDAGDVVIAVGTRAELNSLEELFTPNGSVAQ